ncbi:ADP-ribosyltransferase [Streptomyces sp. CoH17]|uniref:ADP-ribosyltransferase n=1 Tax=Streptomyces sp. CoH17 TaxID=2992806 RepID=UPI00226EFEA5|nr:ADP-ribosyltransferase [Streptomyces sp. CoH17]
MSIWKVYEGDVSDIWSSVNTREASLKFLAEYGDYSPRKYTGFTDEKHTDPQLKEYGKFGGSGYANPTPHESSTVQWYVGKGSVGINGYRRKNPKKPAGPKALAMDELLHRARPSTESTELYRGVSDANYSFGETGSRVGQKFHDPGFTSSSTSYSIAKNFSGGIIAAHASGVKNNKANKSAVLVMHIPKGHRAMTVQNPYEKEVVHPRNMEWRVMADHDLGTHREIHLHPTGTYADYGHKARPKTDPLHPEYEDKGEYRESHSSGPKTTEPPIEVPKTKKEDTNGFVMHQHHMNWD